MLLIYLPVITARSEYIFEYICKHQFKIAYTLTNDKNFFNVYSGGKINYSSRRIGNEFFIKASTLLFEDFIESKHIAVKEKHNTKVFFADDTCDMGFDIFAAAFYMITRYEEYLPFIPDKHGRFNAEDSLAFKNNFLQFPVVDIWINELRNILQKKIPLLQCQSSIFNAIVTYDIDVAYKFKGRSFIKNSGATIKDIIKLDFKNIVARLQTLNNKIQDPWDTYEYLYRIVKDNKLKSAFFFLLGDHSANDKNLHYRNPLIKKLVKAIQTFSDIGIHPSYKTSTFPEKIMKEKIRLEELSGKKIFNSRQHFLKFILPGTYNALIEAGITEDYSMGFPYTPGFRAGTSKPFYFYDLKNEKQTELKIFPITFMEGNFINTNHITPVLANQQIFNLIDEVKKVEGTFISIWHNHTVSDTKEYKQWKEVHDKMIQKISLLNENYEV